MSRDFGKEFMEALENEDKDKSMEIAKDCIAANLEKLQELFNPVDGAEYPFVYAAVKIYLSGLIKIDKEAAEVGESFAGVFDVSVTQTSYPESVGSSEEDE